MRSKKGFTLIELLAVILILGIIALIAIPVVTNIIDEAKKKAAETSAIDTAGKLYIWGINKNGQLANLASTNASLTEPTFFKLKDGVCFITD